MVVHDRWDAVTDLGGWPLIAARGLVRVHPDAISNAEAKAGIGYRARAALRHVTYAVSEAPGTVAGTRVSVARAMQRGGRITGKRRGESWGRSLAPANADWREQTGRRLLS